MKREYTYRGIVAVSHPDTVIKLVQWDKTVVAEDEQDALRKIKKIFYDESKFDGKIAVYGRYLKAGAYVSD